MDQEAYESFEGYVPLSARANYLNLVAPESWRAAMVLDKGLVIGILPYIHQTKGPLVYSGMPSFGKYLGPYIHPSLNSLTRQHQVLEELIRQLPDYAYWQQDFHTSAKNWLPFYWKGFRQTTRYTYYINVEKDPSGQQGLNRNMRRNIKRAADKLRFTNQRSASELYPMLKGTFQRQNMTFPFSEKAVTAYVEGLLALDCARLFFAENETGEVQAASCMIWDGKTAYYHLAGEVEESLGSGAGIALTAQAIEVAGQELSCSTFDFEGSMIPGVEAIRRQFGAYQARYFRVWRVQGWGRLLKLWRDR